MTLAQHLGAERDVVNAALDRLLPPASAWPERLHAAMRYAVFGGGKRVRPILVRAACRAAGGDAAVAVEPGCALELIHTYSLVHDDLPAHDDDTLRRGRPTVHVAYDEALAIMVGDALLTAGFAVLARYPEGEGHAAVRAEALARGAAAIGAQGVVGGPVAALEATGVGGAPRPHPPRQDRRADRRCRRARRAARRRRRRAAARLRRPRRAARPAVPDCR